MSTIPKINIAIIGGGIGGLCLAIGLLKYKHIEVNIYEAASKFGEIGAGISFGPNAERALNMIDKGTLEALFAQATHNGWESRRQTWMQVRAGLEEYNERIITDLRNESGQTSVHRAHFLDELVKLIPSDVSHFGKRALRITDSKEIGVKVEFTDGTSILADAVIGADGVHSITREYILGAEHPATKPQFSHAVAYRAVVPMEEAKAVYGAEYAENSTLWTGRNSVMITYPIAFGSLLNVAAIETGIDEWKYPEQVIPATPEDIGEKFQGYSRAPSMILELMKQRPVYRWSVWHMLEETPYFNKGNVCMMGDAAHSATPFQAQGAGMAIEDSLVLVTLLGHVTKVQEVSATFQTFDQVRRPRTQKNIETSFESGELYSFRNPKVGEDMQEFKTRLDQRMGWIWDFDLEQQNKQAIEILESLISV